MDFKKINNKKYWKIKFSSIFYILIFILISISSALLLIHLKQILYCIFMLNEYCSFLSPFSLSSLLLGGMRKSSRHIAESSMSSFFNARSCMFCGNFLEYLPPNIFCVSLHLKEFIMLFLAIELPQQLLYNVKCKKSISILFNVCLF